MKIALDVDDVLARFTIHAFNHFNKVMPEKLDHWSVPLMDKYLGENWIHKVWLDEEFWGNIPILSSPELIDFNVACYISHFPKEMFKVRSEWLSKNGFPDRPLIWSADKLSTCRHLGIDVLVDDKPATMTSFLEQEDIKGLHFISHYADFKPVGAHIKSLKEVKKQLL